MSAPLIPSFTHLVHHLLGLTVADAEASGLVVSAVRTGYQLPESTRAWEPRLQVQLLTGCVIQGTWKLKETLLLKAVHIRFVNNIT